MNTIRISTGLDTWIKQLSDFDARAAILLRIKRAGGGNFGDHKALGDGVSEMRLDIGPGYRIYYGRQGSTIYLLLHGGTKRTQVKDIKRAKDMWAEIQAANKAALAQAKVKVKKEKS